jgi:polysaccharide export outer membrane protein
MHRLTSLLLLLVVALAAGCTLDAGGNIPLPPGRMVEAEPGYDDPAVEEWFRAPRPHVADEVVAGDLLSVHVTLEGVTTRTLASVTRRVPPNGLLVLPRLDEALDVIGKTRQQIEAEIGTAYAKGEEYEPPYVQVDVEEAAPRNVFVSGEVQAPGRYDLGASAQMTVLQAITLAAGPTEKGDLERVRIQRFYPPRDEVVSSPPLNIKRVMETNEQRDNLTLEPGDTLVVPERDDLWVYLTGHVSKNGPIPYREGMTLSEAIAEAGGFIRFAKRTRIVITRVGAPEPINFDYDEMLDGGVEDLVLEPGDRIFVPEKWI